MKQMKPILPKARAASGIPVLLFVFGSALLLFFSREGPPAPQREAPGKAPSPLATLEIAPDALRGELDALTMIEAIAPRGAAPASLSPEARLFAPPSSPLLDSPGARSALVLFDVPPPPDPATLIGDDSPAFAQALAAYKAGDFAAGDAAVATLKGALPVAAAQWAALRLHPREAGFKRLERFLNEHPNWPASDWLRRQAEESLYSERPADAVVKNFFARTKPVTGAGGLALARVYVKSGDFDAAAALVRQIWRGNDFSESFESALLREFSELLAVTDHKYRADRLLYAEKTAAAMRAAALAGKDEFALARVRAAALANHGDDALFASVPAALQNDPGLLLARVHLLRKRERIAEAAALLLKAPREPERIIDGDAWWVERRLVARKLLDMGDARDAYRICAEHTAKSVSAKVEAEFHAGWIALRFLNDPELAEKHFDAIGGVAETPGQISRAAYWRARASEARRTPQDDAFAHDLYAEAAAYSTTFYGQLAAAKLGVSASPLRPAPKPALGDERVEAVRAVELLLAAGEKESGLMLATEAMRHLCGEAQIAALADIAARRRDAHVSLTLGKLAASRGVALDDMAFPAYGVPSFATLPGSASRSVVYAIARQESAFEPRAVSSAGAMGLMQMIASTARNTAGRLRVGFDLRRMLEEPAFNAQLGAAHLGILLGEHKGSYLLTFAAYNAGGKRVKEWIDAYGDPRQANVDPIDWVERIPIQETRNYVQRVMENLVVYRAKFGELQTREPQVELARAAWATAR
jgi:soluble lytic murein transglycosylase